MGCGIRFVVCDKAFVVSCQTFVSSSQWLSTAKLVKLGSILTLTLTLVVQFKLWRRIEQDQDGWPAIRLLKSASSLTSFAVESRWDDDKGFLFMHS
jgi:hypothetical protein